MAVVRRKPLLWFAAALLAPLPIVPAQAEPERLDSPNRRFFRQNFTHSRLSSRRMHMNIKLSVGRVVTCATLIFAIVIPDAKLAYGQEVLRGLDLSEVSFDLSAPFHNTLLTRALKQFSDAGLKLGEDENMFPRIQLSLKLEESEHCKGIEVYQPKLELLEEVALVRSGHKRIVTTWFKGQEFGYETTHLSLADLQKEQDELLKSFIDQYKFLNAHK